jgi:potassium-transporting ATPase KdpC subunit
MTLLHQLRSALVLTAFFVIVTGLAFPALVWGVGRVAFPEQAAGSFVKDARGRVVGSKLLGQGFQRPEYFHPRPSAAGAGYDGASSGGTNLGPTSRKLVDGTPDDPATPHVDESFTGIVELGRRYREENGLAADARLPADAVTRSGSGLDPHISPENARLQVARVARIRGLSPARVTELVSQHTSGRWLGLIGEPRVSVLELNLALDHAK